MTGLTKRLDTIQARVDAVLPNDARMDAYYYGFERTGVGFIDAVLSAVAIAGKGSHHTESWNVESDYGYYANRPGLPDATNAVELIQKAAEAAAANFADVAFLLDLARKQASALETVRELHSRECEINGDGSSCGIDNCPVQVCGPCGESWPCQTMAALEAKP